MGLKGVKVNGQSYHFDHEYLENNPIPSYGSGDYGGVLSVVISDNSAGLRWEQIQGLDVLRDVPPSGNGMVLAVNDTGNVEWTYIGSDIGPGGIPTYGNDDVLSSLVVADNHDGGGPHLEWRELIPSCDCGNWGGVLVSGDNGPEWRFIEGVLEINDASDGDVLTVVKGDIGGHEYSYLTWGQGGGSGGVSSLPHIPTADTHYMPYVLMVEDNGDDPEWEDFGRLMDRAYEDHYTIDGSDLASYMGSSADMAYALIAGEYGNNPRWAPLWSGERTRILPTCDANDVGKVLTVNNQGEPVWANPT